MSNTYTLYLIRSLAARGALGIQYFSTLQAAEAYGRMYGVKWLVRCNNKIISQGERTSAPSVPY